MKARYENITNHYGNQKITAQITDEYICFTPKDENGNAEKSISISASDFEYIAKLYFAHYKTN